MFDILQFLMAQPWYILALVFGSVAYFMYTNYKSITGFGSAENVSYRYASDTTLTKAQQFAIALDAVMTAYWEVDNNTLGFTHKNEKPHQFESYMNGWGINTKAGYEELTEYFLLEGRRSYFDFIYPLFKNEPKEQWLTKIQQQYGEHERPYKMLERLSKHGVVNMLMQKGVIKAEADMSIGVIGWDISVLVGQARRAYTAGLISEVEALQTIETARQMALKQFSSWDEFGRSQVVGMALDYYRHDDTFFDEYIATFMSVSRDAKSPWHTLAWGA